MYSKWLYHNKGFYNDNIHDRNDNNYNDIMIYWYNDINNDNNKNDNNNNNNNDTNYNDNNLWYHGFYLFQEVCTVWLLWL